MLLLYLKLTYLMHTSAGISSMYGSEYTEEIVNEQLTTGPSFDQVSMHIDSESYDEDNNDQKRCVVDDLDDDL
jgi:hypothetical protein